MNKVRLRLSAFVASYRASSQRVCDEMELLNISDSKPLPYVGAAGIKVAAVNLEPRRYRNLRDYVTHMNEIVSGAAASGVRLIAFPELSGMLPVTLLPHFEAIRADWQRLGPDDPEVLQDAFEASVHAVQGFVAETFHNTFAFLAKAYRIHIAAGSIYLTEGNRIYNRYYLFSDEGEVAGMQDKLFPSPFELAAGVTAADELTPAETRLGRIALLCAPDIIHCEPFLVAGAMGCDFAVAGASVFGGDTSLASVRAQEQRLCVLVPGLTGGSSLGLSFNDPAGVYEPRAAARAQDGTKTPDTQPGIAAARIDLSRFAQQFDLYTDDKNPEFYRALLR